MFMVLEVKRRLTYDTSTERTGDLITKGFMNNSHQNDASAVGAPGSTHPFSESPQKDDRESSVQKESQESSLESMVRSRLQNVYGKADQFAENALDSTSGKNEAQTLQDLERVEVRDKQAKEKRNKQIRKTVKDMESLDSQVRRIKLDPSQSYGTSLKRPTGEQSGTYQVFASPQKPDAEKEEKALVCQACGTKSDKVRLSCANCGSYFNSQVQQTSFEKRKTKEMMKTSSSSLPAYAVKEEATWRSLMLRRLLAKGIDLALIGTIYGIIAFSYFHYANRVVAESPEYEPLFMDITYCVVPLLGIVFLVVYSAVFESSPLMATPGKFVSGLTVSKDGGKTLSHIEALGRSFVAHLPLVLLVVALWFTKMINPAISSMSNQSMITTGQVLGVSGAFCLFAYAVSLAWMMHT